ncbi:DUF4199 domain-containing protein [Autumnicola musiva]|uniref:DUF4199 domain-containing protein n=1 Tax=Autumnicola musiva TaxID=3075589 RepID=A0ABU3D429_9FLAO|nr:DUF4199 domain-containing protein [Zunongwangia sp. F117]MDT0676285.1 DUF4199 domain-containing protein [Zunongwangia sp. F117]
MENPNANSKKIILNYGVILGVISILLGVIMYVTNAYLNPSFIYTVVGFLILAGVIWMGTDAYKKENGGFLSVKEALKIGVGIALIGGILGALWMLLLIFVIEPDYMSQMSDLQREQMMESFPDMPQSQIDQSMEMAGKFSSPWIITAVSLIGNIFFGFLIALVVGFIKRNKNPYEA